MVYSSGWLMAAGVLGVVAALAYLWVFRASLADRVGLVRGHKPLILALFVVLAVFNFLTVMGLAPWFVGTEAREAALLISDRPKAGETAGRACQHHLTLRRAGGAVEGTCADRIVAQPLLPGPVEMTLRTGPAGSAIVEIRPLR
jgi:hypothetical protein